MIFENRNMPRIPVVLNISCVNVSGERNIKINTSKIINLSPKGICIKDNNHLLPGDKVNIIMDGQILPATVIRSDGSNTGLLFPELTREQSKYIKCLCWLWGQDIFIKF